MELDLPELTDEELAIVEGKFDDEPEETQEPAEEAEEAVEEEAPVEDSEVDRLTKANAGLLNDLRETRARAREDRTWRSAIEQRLDLLAKKDEPTEEELNPEPDRGEDPVSWLAWKQKQSIKEEVEPLKEEQASKVTAEQAQEFERAVRVEAQVREHDYLEKSEINEEEYNSRLDDLRLEIGKQFKGQGMTAQQAIQATSNYEREFTVQALRDGLNPADVAMRAWEELKPPRAPWREKKDAVTPANATEGAVSAEPEAKKPLSKVAAANAGKQSAGVGAMSGGGGKTEVTMEMLAEMDPDDPIAQAIFTNEKKFYEINVTGKTSV